MALALDFDWHDRKAASNLEKHGFSFPEAVDVFADPQRIDFDVSRSTDGEERRKTVGMLDGKLMTVVYTRRGSVLWIISARRANRTEAKRYGQG
jgi:uncharacterized DUF497 family protein